MNVVDFIVATYTRNGKQRGYMQTAFFYSASNALLVEYIGLAERGAATADASWIIFKLTYNGNETVNTIQTSVEGSILDDRASLSYA